ncbi:17654_t:CDS:2, partial [Racocetra fulgida]
LLHLEFVSYDEVERLILFFDHDNLEIKDPFYLDKTCKTVVSDLCNKLLNELIDFDEKNLTKSDMQEAKFKTLIDERIYFQGVSKEQWIKYLQEELNDYNRIRALLAKSQIEDILSLTKWKVNGNDKVITAFLKKSDLIMEESTYVVKLSDSFNYKLTKDGILEKLSKKIFEETESKNFLAKIQSLDILTFSFIELTQLSQFLREFLPRTLFIHSTNDPEEIKFNKLFPEPHLQITKIQNNNWDDTTEKPFLSDSLLKIIGIDKTEDNIQQLTVNENKTIEDMIQQLTENKNIIIQKLEANDKIIQELKKNL